MEPLDFGADDRLVSFAVAGERLGLVRTVALDPRRAPFDDPAVYRRALDRSVAAASAEGWPRPRGMAASGRPMFCADPERILQVLIPPSGMTSAHVEVLREVQANQQGIRLIVTEVGR